jgi:hypothetical protein
MAQFLETIDPPSDESTLFFGLGDPNRDEGLAYQRWPIASAADRLGPNGSVVRDLGQQWVVMVAAQWNDHYRRRIADALGIERNDVVEPVMADINRLRNDILHHRGVATSGNAGRCEVLHWFDVGETIRITPGHVAQLMHWVGKVQATREIDPEASWKVYGES